MVNLFSNLFLSEYYVRRQYLFIFISNPLFTKFKSLIIRVLVIFIKNTFQSYIVPITFKLFLHQLMCCLHNLYTILSLCVTSQNVMPPYSRLVPLDLFLIFQRNRVNNLKKQLKEKCYTNINENLNELKTINSKTYWKTINTLLKGESTMNDIPPIQDPKNNYCLSYEGKEKADVLNKYFCSITNLVDENKSLPDFDDR